MKLPLTNLSRATLAFCTILLLCPLSASADGHPKGHNVPADFMELINASLENKTGLTFFLNGQALPAVVTEVIDGHTVIGRSQQYDKIVIRLHRVNAIAKQ